MLLTPDGRQDENHSFDVISSQKRRDWFTLNNVYVFISLVLMAVALCVVVGVGAGADSSIINVKGSSMVLHDVCPFGNIDLFLILDAAALPLAHYLFSSLEIFMPCCNVLHILTERSSFFRLPAWVRAPSGCKLRLHALDYPTSLKWNKLETFGLAQPNFGYLYQAYIAFIADSFVADTGAEFVMFIDTDAAFGLPITCASLFDSAGRPHVAYWPFTHHHQYTLSCELMIGGCIGSFMSFFPFIFPVASFPGLRKHITPRTKTASWEEAYLAWTRGELTDMPADVKLAGPGAQEFSQFVVMGNYLALHEPNRAHIIQCSHLPPQGDSPCLSFLPTASHFWSYSYYLDDGSIPNYWGNRQGNLFSSKWTEDWINILQEQFVAGGCLQYELWGGVRTGGKWRDELWNTTCTLGTGGVHNILKVYQSVPINRTLVVSTFGPQGMNLPRGSAKGFCGVTHTPTEIPHLNT